jgi:NAD(P)-dependent dehydrogenase (short-subunit alcohol dehydrogenase family)
MAIPQRSRKLEGKVALITGGNSGIGLATAKLFRDEGATVVVTASSSETLEQAKADHSELFDIIQCDVSKVSEVDALLQEVGRRHGHLDVVFANAAVVEFRSTTLSDEAFFDWQFNTNVKGLYFTVQKSLPLLQSGASIILNASAVLHKGFKGLSVHSGTKGAVRSFARVWANEFAPRGIRVNVLSPGPTDTPIQSKLGLLPEQLEQYQTTLPSLVPLGRIARPEEIATVALFLASDDSSFMTGAEIAVDGGVAQI